MTDGRYARHDGEPLLELFPNEARVAPREAFRRYKPDEKTRRTDLYDLITEDRVAQSLENSFEFGEIKSPAIQRYEKAGAPERSQPPREQTA